LNEVVGKPESLNQHWLLRGQVQFHRLAEELALGEQVIVV
jgi:hypothetical protein